MSKVNKWKSFQGKQLQVAPYFDKTLAQSIGKRDLLPKNYSL